MERSSFLKLPRVPKTPVRFNCCWSPRSAPYKGILLDESTGKKMELKYGKSGRVHSCIIKRFFATSSCKSNWRCYAVWVGSRPSPEVLSSQKKSLRADGASEVQGATASDADNKVLDFRELARSYEYMSGKLVQFIDKDTGILAVKGPLETIYGRMKAISVSSSTTSIYYCFFRTFQDERHERGWQEGGRGETVLSCPARGRPLLVQQAPGAEQDRGRHGRHPRGSAGKESVSTGIIEKNLIFVTFPDMERQALPWRCWHQDRRATAAAAVVHIRAAAPALSVGGFPG